MHMLAQRIATLMDAPVTDRTGCPVNSSFDLTARSSDTPLEQRMYATLPLPRPRESDAPGFVDALRDQLGVR